MIQVLFGRLRLSRKMGVLLALFAVPIAVTSTILHSTLVQSIKASLLESYGNKYLKHIAELEVGLHDIEYAGYFAATDNGNISEKISHGTQQIDLSINHLVEVHRKYGQSLEEYGLASATRSAFPITPTELQDQWKIIRTAIASADQRKVFKEIELLDEKALLLRTYIANASGLVLDPEHASYYLMIVIVFLSPELQDQLSVFAEQSSNIYGTDSLAKSRSRDAIIRTEGIVFGSILPRLKDAIDAVLASKQSLGQDEQLKVEALHSIILNLERALKELEQSVGSETKSDASLKIKTLESVIEECRSLLTDLSINSQKLLNQMLEKRIAGYRDTQILAIVITIGMFLLLGALSWIIVRGITVPISHLVLAARKAAKEGDLTQKVVIVGGGEIEELGNSFNAMIKNLHEMVLQVQSSGQLVSSSAMEIAAVSKQQQATSSEIAATTIQIETTSKEISSTSKQLVTTMREVSTVAEQTATLANGGQEGIQKMEQTMRGIMEASASISAKLAVLNDKANKINTVVTTISKVADQTNLLSLNAAIEAEKAGEFGQGFAVVAREIRRLADQTAIATLDIEQMVEEMQSAVSAGVMGMERFSDEVRRGAEDIDSISGQLEEIITQVQTLTPRFESVNDGMEAQSSGAQQISDGLTQLSEAAQQTATSIKQSSLSIEHLQSASVRLSESVSGFRLGDVDANA